MSFIKEFWEVSIAFENQTAFVDANEQITFKEFKQRVLQCAHGLEKVGLHQNDTILLAVPVSISFYVHLLAAWYMGLQVLVLTDFKDKASIGKLTKTLNVKCVLTINKLSLLRFFILPFSLWVKTKVVQSKQASLLKPAPLPDDHRALITTTSGITGGPKIAYRNVGFLRTQFETIQDILKLQTGDVHLSSFPIVLLCNLLVGATSIILPSKKHEDFVKKMKGDLFPTLISASPFYTEVLLPLIDFNKVKSIVVGGASLFQSLAKRLMPFEQKTKLIYGSTEVEPIAEATLADFYEADKGQRGIFVGKKHKNLKVKIVDAINGIGELIVQGTHVLPKEHLHNGEHLYVNLEGEKYYKTGDLAYLESEQLFFYGRKKYAWIYEDDLYSPVHCEKWNAEYGIFKEATMLFVDKKNIVFYCGSKDKEDEFKKKAPFIVHGFKRLKELPKDKRHRSRIKYQELLK